MEQKYKDELSKLGFASNAESLKTVLETRAYHNAYAPITDSTYAVLNMPACFDEATEKKLKDAIFATLSDFYKRTETREHFSPGNLSPIRVEKNSIQFEFSFVLSEQEVIAKVMNLLQMTVDAIHEVLLELSPQEPDFKKQKHAATLMGERVKAIQILIEAGSTSYNHITQNYHVFD